MQGSNANHLHTSESPWILLKSPRTLRVSRVIALRQEACTRGEGKNKFSKSRSALASQHDACSSGADRDYSKTHVFLKEHRAYRVCIILEECEVQRACVSKFLHKAGTVYAPKNPRVVLVARIEHAALITPANANTQVCTAPQEAKAFARAPSEAMFCVPSRVKRVWVPKSACVM